MNNHDNTSPTENIPQALVDAEAQLALASKKFKETGETHLGSLVMVCASCKKLKLAYKQTPKHKRPASTWVKYVSLLKERKILDFTSARMADLCIALDKDLQKVDLEKVKELAPDGGYGSVRSAVNTLVGKPQAKKLKKSAAQCLDCAIKEIEAAKELLPDATAELHSIKAAIQKLIAGSQNVSDPADTANPPALVAPPERQQKLTKADPCAVAKATFTPRTVKEIAQQLGSKSALGRAVGKSSKHADYWAEVNKFPVKLRRKLVKAFNKKGQTLDLSLIPPTK